MYLAIDIGGTKTLVACFTPEGEVTESIKFPTPRDYDEFLVELEKTVGTLPTSDFYAAGVAAPGRIDREEGIGRVFGNLPWSNVPIGPDLEAFLNCPVLLENDTKLAGLSEAKLLLDDYSYTLYVTISTGIGAAVIIDGKIEPHLANNEAGHMLLEHDGKLERWEDFASGRALKERTGKYASELDDPGEWYRLARNIAIGLVDLIATLTPEVIVLGGGVGNHLDKFKDRLDEQLRIYEHPMYDIPPIRKAGRPEEAVIYGCYELAKDRFGAVTR